jgi:hypothetical protein
MVAAVIAVLALGGCTRTVARDSPSAVPSPTSQAANAPSSPPTSGPAATVSPSLALCNAREPAPTEPFPFNRDDQARDALVRTAQQMSVPGSMTYAGGIAEFYGIDVATVAQLIADRYLDPYDRQNDAPTAWQILRFMCLHPTVYASGYVVSIDRDDYRTTLDDIAADDLTPELRTAATAFCTNGDNEMDSGLECFWD